MDEGTARDCFAIQFLNDPKTPELGQNQAHFVLGSLLEAGSDTSRMTMSQVIAAAATDPRWVKTAQEQLDSVCGYATRLPQFSDRLKLQYITAATKEAFRWKPFLDVCNPPHMVSRDDEYEGYRFPAGTIFVWNTWNMVLDPNNYEDPERFWPERFLNEDLNNPLKGHIAFGPGSITPSSGSLCRVLIIFFQADGFVLDIMLLTATCGSLWRVCFTASILKKFQ